MYRDSLPHPGSTAPSAPLTVDEAIIAPDLSTGAGPVGQVDHPAAPGRLRVEGLRAWSEYQKVGDASKKG